MLLINEHRVEPNNSSNKFPPLHLEVPSQFLGDFLKLEIIIVTEAEQHSKFSTQLVTLHYN